MTGRTSRIYFILAPDHHDTVSVSAALNDHPAILSLGRGNPSRTHDETCSCGEAVSACPFWSKMKEAAENDESIEEERVFPFPCILPHIPVLMEKDAMNKVIVALLSVAANEVGYKIWRIATEGAERFFGMHDRFLAAAQEWYPHKVFVDGEGSTLKFMAMASMGFPVYGVFHLVRDPRAYVAEQRQKQPGVSVEKLVLEWVGRHRH